MRNTLFVAWKETFSIPHGFPVDDPLRSIRMKNKNIPVFHSLLTGNFPISC